MSRVLPPPDFRSTFRRNPWKLFEEMQRPEVQAQIQRANNRYLPWSKVKRLPMPAGLAAEEFWACVKLTRHQQYREVSLSAAEGRRFRYWLPDSALELLHRIDQMGAGSFESRSERLGGSADAERFLVTSLMEEAISSSILEGAATTRLEAKKLLREGRSARNESERMILNNYRAVTRIRGLKDERLSVEMLNDLHRTMTEGTLDRADAGRFQRPGEKRVTVVDNRTGEVIHVPPRAEELPERIDEVLRLANDRDEHRFMHPVVRAVFLHFAISYIHPYVDGNGRTARAVFYWSMLNQGYWLTQYLSVSSIIRQGPSRYYRAFKNSEMDDFDATYFVLYHLAVIERAIGAFHEYVQRKRRELEGVSQLLRHYPGVNHRQRALLSHAVRNPHATYTFESHRNSHEVSYQTARNDILELVSLGFLEKIRGRPLRFMPVRDLQERIDSTG